MRHTWHNILAILDGQTVPIRTDQRTQRGLRGQSLVEMTLTLPILLLMVMFLAELGLMANNYLIIMDLVREMGRRGSTMTPTLWPDNEARNYNRLDCDTKQPDYFNLEDYHTQGRKVPRGKSVLDGYGYAVGQEGVYNYFDAVVCQGIKSMEPLLFEDMSYWGSDGTTDPNGLNYQKNDIVVSAISYTQMDYTNAANLLPAGGAIDPGGILPPEDVWITVTGRWPLENRYCKVSGSAPGVGDSRDPFDWKRSEYYTFWKNAPAAFDTDELSGTAGTMRGLLGPGNSQGIRGFVFTGKSDAGDGCIGSRFPVQEVERRLNQDFSTNAIAKKVRSGGMVIVEFWWQHQLLFAGPIYHLFNQEGSPEESQPMLYVFGIFPAIGAEPTATPVR
ncbi:MAG: pilus assembly protein [Anaerolinea sp.]|mgnify:CR=1 FL=1|nr:pilus assembly protein [Anaerolinea sp.]MCC6974870.1 pilus assembly protein [Anaerolineae bacterium]